MSTQKQLVMKKFSVLILSVFIALVQFSQLKAQINTTVGDLTVDNTDPLYNNISSMIQNILVQGGTVNVTGIVQTQGSYDQIGYYSDAGATPGYIGFPSAMVMSTAGAAYPITGGTCGPSQLTPYPGGAFNAVVPGDPNIQTTLDLVNFDAPAFDQHRLLVVEFDFMAPAEYVEFYYVFASQEYSGWTCSQYNDIFGFYIDGPNPASPFFPYDGKNIAAVPTDEFQTAFTNLPVMVNTINSGLVTGNYCDTVVDGTNYDVADNTIFWVGNAANLGHLPADQLCNMTGFTLPLRAYLPVVCDSIYHMKLAITDVRDGNLGSAVFLQEASFRSPVNLSFEQEPNVVPDDTTGFFYEGCGNASITFKRPPDWDFAPGTGDLPIFFELVGDATYGQDFVFTNSIWDDHFIIPNWDSIFTLQIQINQDFLTENTEDIVIRIWHLAGGSCHDDGYYDFTFTISDYEFIELDLVDKIVSHCPGDEANFEVNISGGIPQVDSTITNYDIHWSQIGYNAEQTVYPDSTQYYYVYVKDLCAQYTAVDSVLVEVMQYEEMKVNPIEDIYICDNERFDMVFPIDSIYGGDGNYTYYWKDLFSGWTDTGLHISINEGLYQLEVVDGCDNRTFSEFEVFHYEIPETDIVISEMPVELRYRFKGFEVPNNQNVKYMDMKYIWDFGDGSPLFYGKTAVNDYPYYGDYTIILKMENEKGCYKVFEKDLVLRPTYFAPTIFTPNGDGINEGFKVITTRKHEEFVIRIYDRFGKEVFYAEDINDAWFGFTKEGEEAQAGAYVYKVEVKYINMDKKVEHTGVFTLVK